MRSLVIALALCMTLITPIVCAQDDPTSDQKATTGTGMMGGHGGMRMGQHGGMMMGQRGGMMGGEMGTIMKENMNEVQKTIRDLEQAKSNESGRTEAIDKAIKSLEKVRSNMEKCHKMMSDMPGMGKSEGGKESKKSPEEKKTE